MFGSVKRAAGIAAVGAAVLATTVTLGAGGAAADTPACAVGQAPVLSVETAKSAVTICRWQGDGRLQYRGLAKGNGNFIALPASGHDGAYWAYNNGYTYRVSGDALVIVNPNGGVVEAQPAL